MKAKQVDAEKIVANLNHFKTYRLSIHEQFVILARLA